MKTGHMLKSNGGGCFSSGGMVKMGSVMGSGLLEEVPLNQDEGVNSRVREAGRILEMGSAEVAARNGPQNWFPLAHRQFVEDSGVLGAGMEWMGLLESQDRRGHWSLCSEKVAQSSAPESVVTLPWGPGPSRTLSYQHWGPH